MSSDSWYTLSERERADIDAMARAAALGFEGSMRKFLTGARMISKAMTQFSVHTIQGLRVSMLVELLGYREVPGVGSDSMLMLDEEALDDNQAV